MKPQEETRLGALASAYVESRWQRREISAETRRSFNESLGLFSAAIGRNRSLRSITRRDVEHWLGSMACAPATIRLRLSTVRGFFQWCVIEGYGVGDPTLGIRGPKKTRTVAREVAYEDAVLVIKGALDARERVALVLMLEEGLRAGGVAGLRLADIDFRAGTLVVTEKGGHSRLLPLTHVAREVIEAYLAERGIAPGPLLLSHQGPGGLTSSYVSRLASGAIKRAGVDESSHALRHSFAHRLVERGASLRDVQGALGHASIATTQTYLPHTETGRLRELMERGA